jgi:preprotein translocase subunit SecA
MKDFLKKLLGDKHAREVKKVQPLVDEINEIYQELASLTDEELRAKTDEFRAYIAEETGPLERGDRRTAEGPGRGRGRG